MNGNGPDDRGEEARRAARIDELIGAVAAEEDPLPDGLIDDVERFIVGRRRTRRWAIGSVAAAAAVLLVAACWVGMQTPEPAPRVAALPEARQDLAVARPTRPTPAPVAAVIVSAGRDVIAVPVNTSNPKVTIVWLYEAVERPDPQRP